jgi:hypothetical protein
LPSFWPQQPQPPLAESLPDLGCHRSSSIRWTSIGSPSRCRKFPQWTVLEEPGIFTD